MEPFIGQIIGFAGNFAPRGWAFCEGQLLPISSNTALYSILGTTYGGDGRTTFALPDLRGRVMMGPGNGPGLTPRRLGERTGAEMTQLTVANLPAHNHSVTLRGETAVADKFSPLGNMLAAPPVGSPIYAAPAAADELDMGSDSIRESNVGANQAFNNVQPVTAIYSIIALSGTYPSRS